MKAINCIIVFFAITLMACQTTENPDMSALVKPEKHKDGLFLHISSGYDNPHKACMAFNLAVKMSETKDVALFFDTEGVKLLTKSSEDIQMDNFMTMHGALDTLIQHKVRIMACPMCMAKAEIKPEDLKDGIIVAEAEKFFNFTKGRILTLDY